jgi:hypothetical protein
MASGLPRQPAMPSQKVPLVDPATGLITIQWQIFLAGLAGRPPAIVGITPTGSPFAYEAGTGGQLSIKGGIVAKVEITRARVTFDPGLTDGFFPMGQGDVATITYSAAPTLYFVPG